MPSTKESSATEVRYAASILQADSNDPRIQGLQWVTPGSRVLEVGCAHGAVTRLMVEKLGCTVVAVDTNPACAASVHGVATRFVCGDIESPEVLAQIRGEYDHILLMDVLEHCPRPERVLETLRAYAHPKSTFIVTLPNVLVWHVRLPITLGRFEYADSGTLDRTHLRFFSIDSARELLTSSGIDVIDSKTTWNIPFLGQAWLYAQLAEDPHVPAKAIRRFPKAAGIVPALVRSHQFINSLGWLKLLNRSAQVIRRVAPTLWTNHVVMLGRLRAK